MAGGFQVQADGTGFPGVGMVKVDKDEALRKKGGKRHAGRQNDERTSLVRQHTHRMLLYGKKLVYATARACRAGQGP
jgi:hypothetical protein